MIWNKQRILATLKKLHRSRATLAYNSMARTNQALVSAAAYHFGSYRSAVSHAGIDYRQVLRRPRWTRQAIIALIKEARRRGQDLHWSAVTKRGDELARAAFASLQPRLFGRWDRALHAAGLDADDVSMYRTWDRNTIAFELRSRYQNEEDVNSGAVQRDDPALHAAAMRYFGSYERALRAADVDPKAVRRHRQWTKQTIIKELRRAVKKKIRPSDSSMRRYDSALHGAAVRLFGSFPAARKAAGLKLNN